MFTLVGTCDVWVPYRRFPLTGRRLGPVAIKAITAAFLAAALPPSRPDLHGVDLVLLGWQPYAPPPGTRSHGAKPRYCCLPWWRPGGHISPILVAAQNKGIRVVDTRHEVTAVFAADAVGAKRSPPPPPPPPHSYSCRGGAFVRHPRARAHCNPPGFCSPSKLRAQYARVLLVWGHTAGAGGGACSGKGKCIHLLVSQAGTQGIHPPAPPPPLRSPSVSPSLFPSSQPA